MSVGARAKRRTNGGGGGGGRRDVAVVIREGRSQGGGGRRDGWVVAVVAREGTGRSASWVVSKCNGGEERVRVVAHVRSGRAAMSRILATSSERRGSVNGTVAPSGIRMCVQRFRSI